MNSNLSVALINLGVLALTGVVFWITHSWFSLFILLCMYKTKEIDN